jgi:hypothetical protein
MVLITIGRRANYDLRSRSRPLVNRRYEVIAVRTEGGIRYGVDDPEPNSLPFDPAKLITILDEFRR